MQWVKRPLLSLCVCDSDTTAEEQLLAHFHSVGAEQFSLAIAHIICNIGDFLTPWGCLYSRVSCFRMTIIPQTVFVTISARIVDWKAVDQN